jgi:hypothetical protein
MLELSPDQNGDMANEHKLNSLLMDGILACDITECLINMISELCLIKFVSSNCVYIYICFN